MDIEFYVISQTKNNIFVGLIHKEESGRDNEMNIDLHTHKGNHVAKSKDAFQLDSEGPSSTKDGSGVLKVISELSWQW